MAKSPDPVEEALTKYMAIHPRPYSRRELAELYWQVFQGKYPEKLYNLLKDITEEMVNNGGIPDEEDVFNDSARQEPAKPHDELDQFWIEEFRKAK